MTFIVDQKSKNLAGKELGQSRIVEAWDLVEEARLVHPAFGHQKMEVRVGIDPVPEGLNGRDDSGHQLAPRDNLAITSQGAESRAAELPQPPPVVLAEDPQHPGDG